MPLTANGKMADWQGFVLALREYYLRGYQKGYDDAVNGQGREDQAGDARAIRRQEGRERVLCVDQ